MEFKNTAKPVEMFGVEQVVGMKVDASGKMFHTLFAGLYSRKEQSIVRESCANARDAHIKNGNPDRPFKVHIPSTWEPWYSVRDFGTSMTHEFVMERYSTIGYSSKDTSNIEVGSFGLGSKAPLSYTPQFAVIAYLDGERRTYNIHLAENGTPCVALTSRAPSDEEQGLEVRFDVRSPDIETFRRAFAEVALAHPVTPESNIAGTRRANITVDRKAYYRSTDVRHTQIEIGCVWYPIDWGIIKPHLNAAGSSLTHADDFVIRTRIGDVAVTPSRESISYTADTIQALVGYLNGAAEMVETLHRDGISACANVWEANDYVQARSGYERFVVNQMDTPYGAAGSLAEVFVGAGLSAYVEERTVGIRRPKSVSRLSREGTLPLIVRDALAERPKREPARIEHALKLSDHTRGYVVTLPDPRGKVEMASRQLINRGEDRKARKRRLGDLYADTVRQRARLQEIVKEYAALQEFRSENLELPPPVKAETGPPIAVYTPPRVEGGSWTSWGSDGILDRFSLPQQDVYLLFPLELNKFIPHVDFDDLRDALHKLTGRNHHCIGVAKSNYSRLLRRWPFLTPYDSALSATTLPMGQILDWWKAYAEYDTSSSHFSDWNRLERLRRVSRGYEDLCGPLVSAVVRHADAVHDAKHRARKMPVILTDADAPTRKGCDALVRIALKDAAPPPPVGGYEAAALALQAAWQQLGRGVPGLLTTLNHYNHNDAIIHEARALVVGSAILRERDTTEALLHYSEELLAA